MINSKSPRLISIYVDFVNRVNKVWTVNQRILSVRETEETRMVLILQLSHSWAGGLILLYSLNPIPDLGGGGSPQHPLFTDNLKDIDLITCVRAKYMGIDISR